MMRLFEGTQFDRPPTCQRCNQLEESCQCPPPEPEKTPAQQQTARLRVEKRKKGKSVTVVSGLADGHPGKHFQQLLVKLKNHCGAGGTIQDQTIEIQGNHLNRIEQLLREMGFRIGK